MPAPIHVKTDFTPAQLRSLADAVSDRSHARRLRAIAAVLEGQTRTQAARLGGMERQTLRDWVHRFNTDGPDGLKSLRSPGRPPKLDAAQQAELADLIAQGPDPLHGGARRWRLSDLVKLIRDRFSVNHDEVSVGRIMRRLGYVYAGAEWRPVDQAQPQAPPDAAPDEPQETAGYGTGDRAHHLMC